MQWATAQSMLGTALETLGFNGGGVEKLKEAVAAKRAALTVLTKDNARLEWAQAQFNVGNSLNMIGNFEKGTESFEAAIIALTAALEVYTLEDDAAAMGNGAERHRRQLLGTGHAAQ